MASPVPVFQFSKAIIFEYRHQMSAFSTDNPIFFSPPNETNRQGQLPNRKSVPPTAGTLRNRYRPLREKRGDIHTICGLLLVTSACLLNIGCGNGDADVPEANGKPRQQSTRTKTNSPSDEKVNLGEFTITVPQVALGTTIVLEFELFAKIKGSDAEKFKAVLPRVEHRLRDEIIVAVRGVDRKDLWDPDLRQLRQVILDAANRVLKVVQLQSIGLNRFEFFER